MVWMVDWRYWRMSALAASAKAFIWRAITNAASTSTTPNVTVSRYSKLTCARLSMPIHPFLSCRYWNVHLTKGVLAAIFVSQSEAVAATEPSENTGLQVSLPVRGVPVLVRHVPQVTERPQNAFFSLVVAVAWPAVDAPWVTSAITMTATST